MRLRQQAKELRDHARVKAHKVWRHTVTLEHGGFVAIAFIDTFHTHWLLWGVSVYLLVVGIPAVLWDILGKE